MKKNLVSSPNGRGYLMICDKFDGLTQKHYEDAFCSGCVHFLLFTDGDYACQLGYKIERKLVTSKVFGKTILVVRQNGRENIKKSNTSDELDTEFV